MQQIFNFIFKNSYRLLFLLLLAISLIFTIQSHSFHRSKVISSANFLSGGVYSQMNSINEYFDLKHTNEQLAIENARLKTILFNRVDSLTIPNIDSIPEINTRVISVAKVINNSYNVKENYLTVDKGKIDGVEVDLGVINDNGIVGIIENTSKNYATIQSVLNIKSKINAKFKKSSHFGTLIWNGKNTGFAQLIDVPRLASVRKGDTIVTGSESKIFPENIGIGTVERIYTDNQTNYFTLDVKLFNDMTKLSHVYILKNDDTDEIIQLEQETRGDE